jgi:hypothetical protein
MSIRARDLAFSYAKEKFYALLLILPTSVFSLVVPLTFVTNPPVSMVYQILSIVLFLSLISAFLAPETIPQSKIREEEMKEDIEKARNILEED